MQQVHILVCFLPSLTQDFPASLTMWNASLLQIQKKGNFPLGQQEAKCKLQYLMVFWRNASVFLSPCDKVIIGAWKGWVIGFLQGVGTWASLTLQGCPSAAGQPGEVLALGGAGSSQKYPQWYHTEQNLCSLLLAPGALRGVVGWEEPQVRFGAREERQDIANWAKVNAAWTIHSISAPVWPSRVAPVQG